MQVSDYALREGALFDILGRGSEHDPRDASIRALTERYGADPEQAARVERTALALFDQVAESWKLNADDRRLLAWAARIHEIGLAIAHSQYHQHGAYLVEHSDIAGFSRSEQQFLAALVRNQRRDQPASSRRARRRRRPALPHCCACGDAAPQPCTRGLPWSASGHDATCGWNCRGWRRRPA